jgi:hypothetical protein
MKTQNEKKLNPSQIGSCSCKSDFQDKEYGLGLRLFASAPGKGEKNYRCTVCKSERTF